MTKSWWQSKILWVAVITAAIDILALPELGAIMPVAWLPILNALAAALVIILRLFKTDTRLTM